MWLFTTINTGTSIICRKDGGDSRTEFTIVEVDEENAKVRLRHPEGIESSKDWYDFSEIMGALEKSETIEIQR